MVNNRGTPLFSPNKTKYFVLRWFDEVCSEYNEVNQEAET